MEALVDRDLALLFVCSHSLVGWVRPGDLALRGVQIRILLGCLRIRIFILLLTLALDEGSVKVGSQDVIDRC